MSGPAQVGYDLRCISIAPVPGASSLRLRTITSITGCPDFSRPRSWRHGWEPNQPLMVNAAASMRQVHNRRRRRLQVTLRWEPRYDMTEGILVT
jgi:hypothetical protein